MASSQPRRGFVVATWRGMLVTPAVGAAVSTVTASAGELSESGSPGSVCRAVIERTPSARVVEPLVVTMVVAPLASALPIRTPSA